MSEIFSIDLNKSKQNQKITLHEFCYSKSCNKDSMSLPKISYQFTTSYFGETLIMSNEIGLCGLAFCDHFGVCVFGFHFGALMGSLLESFGVT